MLRSKLWLSTALLVGLLQLAVAEQLFSQSQTKMEPRKYVKKDQKWYAELDGKFQRLLTDVVVVKFNPAAAAPDIHRLLEKHQLVAEKIDPARVTEVAIAEDQDAIELLLALRQSSLVKHATLKTTGDTFTDDTPPTELIVADKRFVRKADNWYVKSGERLYEIQPNSLSLKFRKDVTAARQQEFLAAHQFKVLRKNRLGIYDLELRRDRNALDVFAELNGHELIDFVEINTLGSFEVPKQ